MAFSKLVKYIINTKPSNKKLNYYFSQLALTTEERIVKTANSNQKSRDKNTHYNRVRSVCFFLSYNFQYLDINEARHIWIKWI